MSEKINVGNYVFMQVYNELRFWKITAINLGAEGQESTYEMVPINKKENQKIQVPCEMLECVDYIQILEEL